MASRAIGDLSPAMQVICNKHLALCKRDTELLKRGVEVILTCTYRSNEEQARLYAQGRDPNVPGPIVTRARPGQSHHNKVDAKGKPAAEAYDVAIIVNGKAIWADNPTTPENEMMYWEIVGKHGKAAGARWYGDPGSPFFEKPHFQNPNA